MSSDPTTTAAVHYGMTHLKARDPEMTFPTGECGQMGELLSVTDVPTDVNCPQCKRSEHWRMLWSYTSGPGRLEP